MLVRVPQGRTSKIQRGVSRDLLQKLMCGIMVAEKSQNVPSASWGAREADGLSRSVSTGLRTRGHGVSLRTQGQRTWGSDV